MLKHECGFGFTSNKSVIYMISDLNVLQLQGVRCMCVCVLQGGRGGGKLNRGYEF